MNSKRSYVKLLVASAVVGLFVTNCTIKSATDDGSANGGAGNASSGTCTAGTRVNGCICLSDNHVSSQLCGSDGLYGACDCPVSSAGGTSAGGTSSAGGASGTAGMGGTNSAGATTGGYAGSGGYAGGSTAGTAGTGGASACTTGITTADDCYDCLGKACAAEQTACLNEDEAHLDSVTGDYCFRNNPAADPGQMDSILDCIATERGKLLASGKPVVTRDLVRACGSTIGLSSDPSHFTWPPPEMTKATKDLMNCMADAPAAAMAGAWADSNDPASFSQDTDGGLPTPLPWADCTCAKTSCTSPL